MRWALVILVTLVLIGVWVLAFFVPEIRWFAEVLTAIVVFAAMLLIVVPWTRDRMKQAEASRASNKLAAAGDRRPDLSALRARIRKAFRLVRRARGGRGPTRRLPLILVLGPPGSGKTTLLEALGLSVMPVPVPNGGPEGRDAPAPFDVWCSQDAIAVEARVRVEDDDSARDQWLALLAELRRLRPDPPVSAVLLTVSAAEIVSAQWAAFGTSKRLRARIDDVVDRLRRSCPSTS